MPAPVDLEDLVVCSWDPRIAADTSALLGPTGHWTEQQGRSVLGEDRDGPRFRRARTIHTATGTLIAVIAAATNTIHPARLRGYVEVLPAWRRLGIGSAALGLLYSLAAEDGRGFEGKAQRGSAGHCFMLNQRFVEIQRTRTVRLDPRKLSHGPASLPATVEVYRPGEPVPDEFLRAWLAMYQATHHWNPPAVLPLERAREVFIADGDTALAARNRTHITGVAFVYQNGQDTYITACSTDPADPHGPDIVRSLFASAIQLHSDRELLAEVDDAMTPTVVVAEHCSAGIGDDTVIAATANQPE